MTYHIKDPAAFKQSNLQNWYNNSEFWLRGTMRHLKDVSHSTAEILGDLLTQIGDGTRPTLIDFGCGEGWLLRLIEDQGFRVNYVGVDFNEKFIRPLSARYQDRGNVRFALYDLEEELPTQLVSQADIATNVFNLFEIPNISAAVRNVARSLKPGGTLVILTIDPVMQLLAVSETLDDFKASLKEYETYQSELGYDKDIDVGDFKSGRIYKSILYSIATYVELAKANDLRLIDYREVVKTGNFVPQIYQYVVFRK
jgi:SAM-dependent methyltransferase